MPEGVALDAPLCELIGLAHEGRVDLSHTLIVLEDGAQATLVRESAGRGEGLLQSLHVGAVEVFLAQGARLRLVNIQGNCGRGNLALQPGTGSGRPRR